MQLPRENDVCRQQSTSLILSKQTAKVSASQVSISNPARFDRMPPGKKKKTDVRSVDLKTVENHIFHAPNMGVGAKVFNELERFQVFMDY